MNRPNCPTPPPVRNSLGWVKGSDPVGRDSILRPRKGLLYNADGSVAVWADGSDDFPIRTPDLVLQRYGKTVLAMDASGRWYALQPSPDSNKRQSLVHENGNVYWDDIANERLTRFPNSVLTSPGCDPRFATFSACGGANTSTIGSMSKEDLAEILKPLLVEDPEQATDAACLPALAGFNGASPVRLPAAGGKKIIACAASGDTAACWKTADAGYEYYPLATPQSLWTRPGVGGTANTIQTVQLQNVPERLCPDKALYIEIMGSIGSNAAAFTAALIVNGKNICGNQGDSMTAQNDCIVPLPANGQVTIQTVQYGGSAYGWGGGVVLMGYWR